MIKSDSAAEVGGLVKVFNKAAKVAIPFKYDSYEVFETYFVVRIHCQLIKYELFIKLLEFLKTFDYEPYRISFVPKEDTISDEKVSVVEVRLFFK